MDVDLDDITKENFQILPEIDLYLHLLVMVYLLDKQDYDQVSKH